MTAASVAALTVYDMVKGVERGVEIGGVRLVSKSGGKSGEWIRHDRRRPRGGVGRAAPGRPRRAAGSRKPGRDEPRLTQAAADDAG